MTEYRYVETGKLRRRCGLISVVGCFALASMAGGESLYKIDPGPHDVRVAGDITIADPVQQREVSFRVMYPAGDGSFPLVVFSHGAFCGPRMYDRITQHWVSHGYVVIEPNHMDSPDNAEPASRDDTSMLLPTRLREASLALDAADVIAGRAGIDGRIDAERAAMAGHSFGAAIASMKTGLRLKPEFQGPWGDPYDDRFQAAVLLSAPGPGKELADQAFKGLKVPLIATGGSADAGRGYTGDISPGDWRRLTYELAPPGDKYSVIVEGADHFLGGLICDPERGGDPDPGAVAIVRAMTTAFLDAYVNDDEAAIDFLVTADVAALTEGRADYRRR